MLQNAKTLGLTLALLLVVALPAAAQDSVAGKWIFNMQTPQGPMDSEFVFMQNGSEVTGTADLQVVDGATISDGLYEDGILSFLLHVSMEGQSFAVEMEADVTGDEMTGEAYLAEMGAAMPFTAKRAAGQ
jgi:hypothetical protein